MEIVTYVDFVDPIGHAHKAGLRSGIDNFSLLNSIECFPRIHVVFCCITVLPKKDALFVTNFFMTVENFNLCVKVFYCQE